MVLSLLKFLSVSNLQELFHQQTYQDYLTKLDALKVNWNLEFLKGISILRCVAIHAYSYIAS